MPIDRRTFLASLAAISGARLDLSGLAFQAPWPPLLEALEDPASDTRKVYWAGDKPVGGTFSVTFCGRSTAPIAYDASPDQVNAALGPLGFEAVAIDNEENGRPTFLLRPKGAKVIKAARRY
jgi:hypothetical protein